MPEAPTIERAEDQLTKKEAEELEYAVLKDAEKLDYTDDQIKELKKQVFAEFRAIKKEYQNLEGIGDYHAFCDEMDNQYDGVMPRREGQQFNLDCGLTKVKIDDIVGTAVSAHFEQDPNISVKPRPGFAKQGGGEICEKQQDFLDYALDERIPYREIFEMAAHSAILKKVGWIKWIHKITKEKRIRKETYQAEFEDSVDPNTQQPIKINKGLIRFLKAYEKEVKENPQKYKWVIDKLNRDKPVTLDVEYDETTYNDPFPKYVDPKNMYVRTATEGYEEMKEALLTVERVSFSYYKLKEFEKKYDFINVDKLLYEDKEAEERGEKKEGAENETYDVLECVYHFKEGEGDDEEEKKIICFFSEEKEFFLGGIYYPYTVLDAYYVPHYAKKKKSGILGESVAGDLSDTHISKNAILNLTLEAAWISNVVTPIVEEGSAIDTQFQEKSWTHGVPLNKQKGHKIRDDIDFLSNYMKPPDLRSLMVLMAELSRQGDDISGPSGLRTGRESPLDPTAPMGKTLALLQESGKSVKKYVIKLSDGFTVDANCVLGIYYEISQGDQLYISRRTKKISGENPFTAISRSEMIAKTSIQSMAYAFDYDKLNAKREYAAWWAMVRPEPLFGNNPEAVLAGLRLITKSWSPSLRNAVDIMLPSLEKLKQQQAQVAVQAVGMYVKAVAENAKITGKTPEFNPKDLMAAITTAVSEIATPPPEAVQKARAKAAEKGVPSA